MAGRTPDYNVTAMLSGEGAVKGNIGAGWKNPDGSISIRLDAFIVLSALDNPAIRLWLRDPLPKPQTKTRQPSADPNDDTPF